MVKPYGVLTAEIRFWRAVDKSGPMHPELGQCWTWMRRLDKDGYGSIMKNREVYQAHKFSWVIHFGAVPDGLWILHKCDNPSCVNPSHLFVGTSQVNTSDKVSKNRQAKGERFKSAKLSDDLVRYIRKRYRRYDKRNGGVAIAKELGVSATAVYFVVKRQRWVHVG